MIKPGWVHPLIEDGGPRTYHDGTPRYDGLLKNFKEALAEWQAAGYTEDDEENPRPREDQYMPDWAPGEATRFVMYETVSSGTPISPDFATAEELARWLADHQDRHIQGTYEDWMIAIREGSAIHFIAMEDGHSEIRTIHGNGEIRKDTRFRITSLSRNQLTFYCPQHLHRRMISLSHVRPEVTIVETSPENYTATVKDGDSLWLKLFNSLLVSQMQ